VQDVRKRLNRLSLSPDPITLFILLLVSGWSSNLSYSHYIYPEIRYRTFVQGVGLTSDIVVDTVTSDTLSKKVLIDYYVNHPL